MTYPVAITDWAPTHTRFNIFESIVSDTTQSGFVAVRSKEEVIDTLLASENFLRSLEKDKKEFSENYTNLRKYPKLTEKDWE